MRKVTRKMDLRCQMPWLCWESLFSMLHIFLTDKGSFLIPDLMIYVNYVLIIIVLMFIHVCMSLSNRIMIVL